MHGVGNTFEDEYDPYVITDEPNKAPAAFQYEYDPYVITDEPNKASATFQNEHDPYVIKGQSQEWPNTGSTTQHTYPSYPGPNCGTGFPAHTMPSTHYQSFRTPYEQFTDPVGPSNVFVDVDFVLPPGMIRIEELEDDEDLEPDIHTGANLDQQQEHQSQLAVSEARTQDSDTHDLQTVCGCKWTDAGFFMLDPDCEDFECLETSALESVTTTIPTPVSPLFASNTSPVTYYPTPRCIVPQPTSTERGVWRYLNPEGM
jgi:hypothetical protein